MKRISAIVSSRKFHVSWLLAWFSAAFLFGVLSVRVLSFEVAFITLILAFSFIIISVIRKDILGVALIILSGLLVGVWRGGNELQTVSQLDSYIGQSVVVQGIIVDDPTIDIDGDIRFRLRDVQVNGNEVGGSVWSSTSDNIDLKRSDIVLLEGELSEGFGTLVGAVYRSVILDTQRVPGSDPGLIVRDAFADGIRTAIREPEGSLGAGFLVGQKSNLPEKLDQEMRLLGLTHIVVASGFNLTILVRFARKLTFRISRFTALAVSSGLVFSFYHISGNSPSMARASLITMLSLFGWYFGRKTHPLVLLPFAAAVTVYIEPSYIWGDIGWLLSFSSFIGIIMFSPLIHSYFWGDAPPGGIRQVCVETISAQALTLPIIAYVFGQYSPLSVFANLLIVPLIPIAMILTFIAGLAGIIFSSGSSIIGWPAETLMGYMVNIVDWLARLPQASYEFTMKPEHIVVYLCTLLVISLYMWRRTGHKFNTYNIVE